MTQGIAQGPVWLPGLLQQLGEGGSRPPPPQAAGEPGGGATATQLAELSGRLADLPLALQQLGENVKLQVQAAVKGAYSAGVIVLAAYPAQLLGPRGRMESSASPPPLPPPHFSAH